MCSENLSVEVKVRIECGELPSGVLRSILRRCPKISKSNLGPVLAEAFGNSILVHHVWNWKERQESDAYDTQFNVWVIVSLLEKNVQLLWDVQYCKSEYLRIQLALEMEGWAEKQTALNLVSFECLSEKIRTFTGEIACIQALWDGDTTGWHVSLFVILRHGSHFEEKHLGVVKIGSDIRLFDGRVPPWPEAQLAAEVGSKLAKHFGCEFYFPSPLEPDDKCESWVSIKG
jgi:hypothetical protein